MRKAPLFGTGFKDQSPVISAQKRVNLYVVPEGDPDKSGFHLSCTPGLTAFSYLGEYPSRGAISVDGNMFTVHRDELYRMDANGAAALIGKIGSSAGHVSFAWNGTTLVLVDGVGGYSYTSGVLAPIVADWMPANPTTVTFLASRFVVNEGGTGKVWWSDLLAVTGDGTNFRTAETETDNVVAVVADHGILHVMGELTTEFWAPSGDQNVFSLIGASGAEWGCASIGSIAKYDTGLMWLAKNTQGEVRAVRSSGTSVRAVDEPNVSREINAQDVGTVSAFSYVMDGRSFYQANFPAVSLLYDGSGWNYVSSGVEGGRHIANVRAALSEIPYVFHYEVGMVYRLDKDNLTDNGHAIVREVVTKHFTNDFNPLTIWELYVNCEVGTAATPLYPLESAPQMMMQYSKDGGMTWSQELWASMGNVGKYLTRVIWRRLGRSRDWVFKFRVTDKVRVNIIVAALTVE